MLTNMDQRTISIDTPLGNLTAEINDIDGYPGIFIYIKRDDFTDISLVMAEVEIETQKVNAYLWKDTFTDDYTNSYIWSKEEIESAPF